MMPAVAPDGARLLCVVNNDFGELGLALLLTHGTPLATRTTLLLPPRLFALNGAGLPMRTGHYASYADLMGVIEAEAPDVVLFCSAYLLPAHGLVSAEDLARLLDALAQRGCRVVTSDPFWGLLTIPVPVPPRYTPLVGVARMLKDLVHLFFAPVDIDGVRSVTFHNPSFVNADIPPVPESFWRTAGVTRASSDSPFWLFPLTSEDYKLQVRLAGKGAFTGVVAARLEDALSAGRWPVLIAPDECLHAVAARFKYAGAAALVPYCDYQRFLSLLVHAEHAFYWNAGSTSSHVRMLRGLSQFSFDSGHVGRIVEGWLQQISRHYYQGRQLPGLNQTDRLMPERLAARADAFRPFSDDIRRRLAQGPTPEAMIAAVMTGAGRAPAAERPSNSGTGDATRG